jgi:hypothetical protein
VWNYLRIGRLPAERYPAEWPSRPKPWVFEQDAPVVLRQLMEEMAQTRAARLRQTTIEQWRRGQGSARQRQGAEVPCACGCGRTIYRRPWELRDRPGPVFFSKACAAGARWKNGKGLEGFVSTLPAPARQRWHGRWNGHKGGPSGIEAGRAKGGRPPLLTPDQQVQILTLNKQGLSSRKIAETVLGEARLYKRVQRFLLR